MVNFDLGQLVPHYWDNMAPAQIISPFASAVTVACCYATLYNHQLKQWHGDMRHFIIMSDMRPSSPRRGVETSVA